MTAVSISAPKRVVELTVDGQTVRVTEGSTILDACRRLGIDTPTLCFGDTLTPVNVCRVCVVELEKARTLVPACSRKVEDGMVVLTDSERVRTSRRLVMELLGSATDLSTAPEALARLVSGRTRGGVAAELGLIAEVGQCMRDASICGLGQTASSAIASAIGRLAVFGGDAR